MTKVFKQVPSFNFIMYLLKGRRFLMIWGFVGPGVGGNFHFNLLKIMKILFSFD